MATVTPTSTPLLPGKLVKVVWAAIGDSDTCTAVPLLGWRPYAVQVTGTFGSATVILQGSIDGTNFYTMVDNAAAAISKTSAGASAVRDPTYTVKPSTSGGTGSSTTVTLLIRKDF